MKEHPSQKDLTNSIKKDIDYILNKNKSSKKNGDLWTSRASDNFKKIFETDLDNFLANFRGNEFFINEYPPFSKNFLSNLIPYKNMVFKNVIGKFNLLREKEKILLKNELIFNHTGNPHYLEKDGLLFNKRWIYNVHYTYLIQNYIPELFNNKNAIICDIGGGYGILLYMLKKLNFQGTLVLVEFPEQLITARYFLQKNFENLKINSLQEIYDHKNNFDQSFLKKFDIFLCPIDLFNKINEIKLDLAVNCFSLGEMSKKNFLDYIHSNLIKNARYFFSINRIFSKNEYGTDIDILDYCYERFQKLHFEINQFDIDYILQYKRYFGFTKKINSQFVEFIGKKNEK